jgi:hypothetical protein
LAIREANDPDHPDTAGNLYDLGSVLMIEGDLAGACESFERALNIYRNAHDVSPADVAVTAGQLAKARAMLNNRPNVKIYPGM